MSKRVSICRWVRGVVLAGLVVGSGPGLASAGAKDRIWTSSTGSQIEASYVARVGKEHWLLEKNGRILKLTADKFSPADAKQLEATPTGGDDWFSTGRVVAVTTKDPAVLETWEALLATKIPTFNLKQMGMVEALVQLSVAIEQYDPKHRRVEFHLDPRFSTRAESVSTRNLTAARVLSFVVNSQPEPVFITITAGRITLSPTPVHPGAQ